MNNFKIGIASISFRNHDAEEILSAAKKAGLCYIEWGSDIHAPYNDKNRLAELVALQKKYGIKCSSYGTYFKIGVTDINLLPEYINAAKILGTDILRLWCGNRGFREYSPTEKAALFAKCNQAAKIAEKHNVTLCMECHTNTFTDEKEGALELMQEVNSPHFRMYWQPNQNRTTEQNLEYIKLLKKYITHLHVFYWEGKKRLSIEQGISMWKEYLSLFKENHILLLEFMPDDNIGSLSKEAESLRKITAGIEKDGIL